MSWIRQDSQREDTQSPDHSPVTTTPTPSQGPVAPRETVSRNVNIGKSVHIKGEISGNEDMVIEGRIEGKIDLKDHTLTIGADSRITGEVVAKAAIVVGEMNGNVTAYDRVEVAASGSMQGDIISPRVVLADGARFKGSVDMEVKAQSPVKPATQAQTRPQQPTQATDKATSPATTQKVQQGTGSM